MSGEGGESRSPSPALEAADWHGLRVIPGVADGPVSRHRREYARFASEGAVSLPPKFARPPISHRKSTSAMRVMPLLD